MNQITINDETLAQDTRIKVVEHSNIGVFDLKVFELNNFKYQTIQHRPSQSPDFTPQLFVSAWKKTEEGCEIKAFQALNNNSLTLGSTLSLAIEALENLLGRKVAI